MFMATFLIALLVSLVATGVVASWSPPSRRLRPRAAGTMESAGAGINAIALFMLLFLLTWAGGLWLAPFGPSWWGVAWAPFLIVAVLMSLLIGAIASLAAPPMDRRARNDTEHDKASARAEPPAGAQANDQQRAVEASLENAPPSIIWLSFLYWILLVLLLASILAYYVRPMR